MLPLSRSESRKGSNHPLHWTPERNPTFEDLKRELLKPLAPFLVNPFVARTDARDYAMGAVYCLSLLRKKERTTRLHSKL